MDFILPSPLKTFTVLLENIVRSEFWKSVLFSVTRILWGFLLSATLGVLLALRPGIAEVDVDPLAFIFRRDILVDESDIEGGQKHVFNRFLSERRRDVAARGAQHVAGNGDRQIIHILILMNHLRGRYALTAAQLKDYRIVVAKEITAPITLHRVITVQHL